MKKYIYVRKITKNFNKGEKGSAATMLQHRGHDSRRPLRQSRRTH